MTVLLPCTMSGFLLPPHLIYCGKTNKCHPNIILPPGWDIHHTESHWSTEDTMLHFIESVLVPYVQSTRERLGLEKDHFAVVLFKVFTAQRCDSVLQLLEKITSSASLYQPIALESCKKQLGDGIELEHIKPDLGISVLKQLHARWLIEAVSNLSSNVIIEGFIKAGIMDSITD